MAKVIIGIHGLSNKPPKVLLEKWWYMSIIEGLNANRKDDIPDFKFELVYWADLLYEHPLREEITDVDDPLYLDEPYKKGVRKIRQITHDKRRKFLNFIRIILRKLLLNDDLSINYTQIADAVIHRYYKDLESYYNYKKTDKSGNQVLYKDLIRDRLTQILIKYKNDDILLLAHSMGSIIAYDVLSLNSDKIKINTLVTFGSPLGFSVVMGKIASEFRNKFPNFKKLTTPESVKYNWYNFSDIDDEIAINNNLTNDFDENENGVKVVDFSVFNNYIINKTKNPHKSFGYLRTKEIAKTICKFITEDETVLRKRIKFNIFKFQIDIKIKTKQKNELD